MTKKDYIKAAQMIQTQYAGASAPSEEAKRNACIDLLVDFFRADNDLFKEAQFRKACLKEST